VDLVLEPTVDITATQSHVSFESLPPPPDPEPLVAEAEFPAPAQPATTSSVTSPRAKISRSATSTSVTPTRAGTAIAQPAAQTYTTQPPYPPRAREAGAEGVVRLQVKVGIDGRPREVKIVRPSGRSDFDHSSINTVQRDWRFRPARTTDGAAVESTIVVAIRFNLKS